MASSMEPLWFRSKSTACSSMTGLCAANVITLDNFPLEFHSAQYGEQSILQPDVNIIQSPDRLERRINTVATMLHTVSVKPCTSGKHVHNFLASSTSKPHMRRWVCANSAVQRLRWYFGWFQHRLAAEPRLVYSQCFGLSRLFETLRNCANTQIVVHPTTRRLTPKQRNSYPVIQSDCLTTPIAVSVYVCFAAASCPGKRSLNSSPP